MENSRAIRSADLRTEQTLRPLAAVHHTNGGEFGLTPGAWTIVDPCSMALVRRVQEEAEKSVERFGSGERESNYVRSAKAGSDEDG